MTLIKSLGLKVWAYVAGSLALLLVMYNVYKAGGDKKTIDDLNEAIDSIKRSKEVEEHIRTLDDDDVTNELRDNDWIKPKK